MPGVVLAGLMMAYIAMAVAIRPSRQGEKMRFSLGGLPAAMAELMPMSVLIFLVMGTIYLGVATPTEAAALGSLGAMALAAAYRKLNWQVLKESLLNAAKLTSWLMLLVIGSITLSMGLGALKVPAMLTALVVSLPVGRLVILAMIMLLLIALGAFIDGISIMLLTLPILFPLILSLGFDPVWFGVLMTINVECAQVTPPHGINLFVIDGISGGEHFGDVVRGTMPFFLCIVVLVVLLLAFPDIALWLPSTMK